MEKFLKTIVIFTCLMGIFGELVIRTFHLVPDIPERYIDDYNIQRYKPNQSGYYTKASQKWNVNEYGWLGTHENRKERTVSIIGDSFIENIMNPLECNKGSILKEHFPAYSFFEAGRSGVTFIEAIEISAMLNEEINPKYQLLYLNTSDFLESVSEIERYSDRLQISLESEKLLPSKIKSAGLKKILYNMKLLYYLYLKCPLLIAKQNRGEDFKSNPKPKTDNDLIYNDLFKYCVTNYNLDKLIFVFHPDTVKVLVDLAHKYNIKTLILDSDGDKMWALGDHDGHWSCYGHNQVGKQVASGIQEIMP